MLTIEVRDAERSAAASRQRVLQQRERVEATGKEISTAKNALVDLGERFPSHLETLRAIRDHVEALSKERRTRDDSLHQAEKQLKRWEKNLATARQRLRSLVLAPPTQSTTTPPTPPRIPKPTPRHRTRPFGLPPVKAATPKTPRAKTSRGPSLPKLNWGMDEASPIVAMNAGEGAIIQLSDHLPELVTTLRRTVKRLEDDNARLRLRLKAAENRLGDVETDQLDFAQQLHQQEGDLDVLRVGQQRLEDLHDRIATQQDADTQKRLDHDDDRLFAEWNDVPTRSGKARQDSPTKKHEHGASLTPDTAAEDNPEEIFDETFDRDVSALIRLMGKYQVERVDVSSSGERN
ncbi:MAG: hypothetical protein KAI47_10955 [Deltaproteobacteria bacterium]|nr:hypothetical protein [Deltaproteobacteria bacterium]